MMLQFPVYVTRIELATNLSSYVKKSEMAKIQKHKKTPAASLSVLEDNDAEPET